MNVPFSRYSASGLHGPELDGPVPVARHDHHRDAETLRLEGLQEGDPVHVGEAVVEQHHVELGPSQDGQTFGCGGSGLDDELGPLGLLQQVRHELGVLGVVIDDEDPDCRRQRHLVRPFSGARPGHLSPVGRLLDGYRGGCEGSVLHQDVEERVHIRRISGGVGFLGLGVPQDFGEHRGKILGVTPRSWPGRSDREVVGFPTEERNAAASPRSTCWSTWSTFLRSSRSSAVFSQREKVVLSGGRQDLDLDGPRFLVLCLRM